MLDFSSEDIDGMDDDASEEQESPPTGRWTPTSSYDVYMVDAPKDDDEERNDAQKLVPLRSSQSGDTSAAPNPASTEITITQTQHWRKANRCRTTTIRIIKPNKQILSRIIIRMT